MSKSKKVSNPNNQVEELYNSLSNNISKSVELLTDLDKTLKGIFKPKKTMNNEEIETIYKDFLEKSNFIDTMKIAIENNNKEKEKVVSKIGKLISKGGNTEEMEKLQKEYLKCCDKIGSIEKDLNGLDKDRSSTIKKITLLYKKYESKAPEKQTKIIKETKEKKS